jgi:uncharacterized repeat protein (TIGR03803 family)
LAGVVRDASGNLYGMTPACGAYNQGTVYEVTPSGTETILHSFDNNGTDGYDPLAGLILDRKGNLYGATSSGGAHNWGTVFELAPSGTETILWSFGNSPDGAWPHGDLVLDKKGNLYGTTSAGGTYGYGTVFKLTHTKKGWTETILYSFNPFNGTDGSGPIGRLVMDRSGNLYGTTEYGGAYYGTGANGV